MKNRKAKKGFTIIELVIVIAVIGILAAVLIPTFSGVIDKANASAAAQNAKVIYEEASVAAAMGSVNLEGMLIGDAKGNVYKVVGSELVLQQNVTLAETTKMDVKSHMYIELANKVTVSVNNNNVASFKLNGTDLTTTAMTIVDIDGNKVTEITESGWYSFKITASNVNYSGVFYYTAA